MSDRQVIAAALTWTGEQFERGVRITIEDGAITGIDRSTESATLTLDRTAVLPGFINAHSHAFQRGLRGRGETFPGVAGSFWSWREAMYQLVDQLDCARMKALATQAFLEMRDAGITTVGEFHYAHHNASGAGFALDEIILEAAREAGIRIVLLNAYYEKGGLDGNGHHPLAGGQLRFATESLETYWAQMDRLISRLDRATQSLGAVAHSIRAVPLNRIAELYVEAMRRGMVFHMHVEEQPREIEDCVHRYGKPPMALLNEHLQIGPRFTAVHCTHSATADLEAYLDAGGNVCICPLTEANLGDGIANIPRMIRQDGCICLGSDSNARISMIEEMRWLEYVQRLSLQQRGICRDARGRVAEPLLRCATIDGARALGLRAGEIRPGRVADFVAIDLDAPALAGCEDEAVLAAMLFGAGNDVIAGTCVGGSWRWRGGHEPTE